MTTNAATAINFACMRAAAIFWLCAGLLLATTAAAAPVNDPALDLHAVQTGSLGVPGAVPEGYVITPAGYFHPSCVRHVRADDIVDMSSASISSASGPSRAFQSCEYPHFTAEGTRVDTALSANLHPADQASHAGAQPADSGVIITDQTLFVGTFDRYDGWIESVYATLPKSSSISYLKADFSVPQAPVNTIPSINYFFPGAQTLQTHANSTIIQPVLGFNSYANLHKWTLASWNCCVDGNVNVSDYIVVAPGNTVRGTMQGSGCSATTGVCSTWKIVTADMTTNKSVTLNTTGYGEEFNWVFGGVLEVYGVGSCKDLSASRKIDFKGITAKDVANRNLTLNFVTEWPSSSVACGYGVYTLTNHTAYELTF